MARDQLGISRGEYARISIALAEYGTGYTQLYSTLRSTRDRLRNAMTHAAPGTDLRAAADRLATLDTWIDQLVTEAKGIDPDKLH